MLDAADPVLYPASEGFQWEPPYEGAGPETPAWEVTPASVGQLAENAFDPSHSESNVLGNDYEFPDYARKPRTSVLSQLPMGGLQGARVVQTRKGPMLWVGSPEKFLPPDGDYPGGSTGIPLDGYLAYETGWANDGPFHGELAPMQEAGIADKAVPLALRSKGRPMLWVGSPEKFLPPDGDYPGGSTGIPLDGYLAYETGWANDGPFHGELAPMQEAGIADKAVPLALRSKGRKLNLPVLSIMDPGSQPEPFDDWDLGNAQADLDKTYDKNLWENPRQPLSKYNMGKASCIIGNDCHDGTHQGGLHDNGLQLYDNKPWSRGSIDPNGDKAVHAEYKARSKQQTLRMMSHGPAHQVHHAAHKRGRGAPMPKLGHGFVQHTAAPVKKGPNHVASKTRTYKNIMVG